MSTPSIRREPHEERRPRPFITSRVANQTLPGGLTIVPVTDRPPSHLVVAWKSANPNPLVRSFVEIAAANYPAPMSAQRQSRKRTRRTEGTIT